VPKFTHFNEIEAKKVGADFCERIFLRLSGLLSGSFPVFISFKRAHVCARVELEELEEEKSLPKKVGL